MLCIDNRRGFDKLLVAAIFSLSLLVLSSQAFAQSAGGGGGAGGESGAGEISAASTNVPPTNVNIPTPRPSLSKIDLEIREPCRTLARNERNDKCR